MTEAIFLSYASQDADAARRICESLRAAGLEVWFDQSELRGGDAWDASIRKQIKECALFVPMISANTNAREEGYFRLEWKLAVDRSHLMADNKAFFVPVMLGDVSEPAALVPDKFRERQWSRLNDDQAIATFAARVSKLLAGSGVSSNNAPNAAPVLAKAASFAAAPTTMRTHGADEGFWVAVLPFKYRGSNADLAALAEGMSEDIVTGLSRFSYLRVIARGATLQLKSEAIDARAAGNALGARYVMEGNLRSAGTSLRVSVKLVDMNSGVTLWAETYERAFNPEDIFALQDDLVPRIVSTSGDRFGVLARSISDTVREFEPMQLSAYEALMRGFGYHHRLTPAEHLQARGALERAVDLAPANADCWAMLSWVYAHEYAHGFNVRPDSLERALTTARRSVDLAPSNALAQQALAVVFFFRKEMKACISSAERAITLNPLDASNEAIFLITFTGQWERGCTLIRNAMAVNPHHPRWYGVVLGINEYRLANYRGAVDEATAAVAPDVFWTNLLFAAAYGQLGELTSARHALRDALAQKPDLIHGTGDLLEKWFDLHLSARLLDGLAKAGLDAHTPAAKFTEPPVSSLDASIAVLAFANRSASVDDEYFSDGLADELLNVLAKIKGLRVAARTSAFSFKGKQTTVAEIGRALNVATVLEGSVRKSGNRARISVQLVKVSDGYHLWSETYDRTLDDIFAVQDDIAQAVVKELRSTLIGDVATVASNKTIIAEIASAAMDRSDNGEAQRLFLQGRYLLSRKSEEDLPRSVEYLQAAVALDPGFALAWAVLAEAKSDAAGWGTAPVHEANTQALTVAYKALALAPNLVQAHLSMASIQMRYQWDWVSAEASIQRALQLAPDNVDVLTSAMRLSFCMRHFDEAETFGQRAVALDPLNAASHRMLAMALFSAGKLDSAAGIMRQSLDISPDAIASRHILAIVLSAQGRYDEALAEAMLEKAEWARLTALTIIRWTMGTATDKLESNNALARLVEKHGLYSAVQISSLYAIRGDADATFLWLERAYQQRDSGLMYSNALPFFDPVKHDPRWSPFLKKMGLVD